MKKLASLAFTAMFGICGFAAAGENGNTAAPAVNPHLARVADLGMTRETYRDSDGKTLGYCQGIYNADKPGDFALTVFFHGAGERGSDNAAQLFHCVPQIVGHIRKTGLKMIVIAPQCPAGSQWVNVPWNGKSHTIPAQPSVPMNLAMRLIDAKTAEFKVNPKRITVAGISMGGFGTWDIISRRPDFFAAAVPVCGGADLLMAPKLVNLPLRVWHGDSDTTVLTSRSRDMVRALQAASAKDLVYTEVPKCGHLSWVPAFKDAATLDFLLTSEKK